MFAQGIMTQAMKQIFSDSKRTVTLYRVTKTNSNLTGTEQLTYDSGTSVELIFFKTDAKFEFGMEGLLEKGDCLVFDKPNNLNIVRDDKITVDDESFLIKDIIHWNSRDLHVYDAMNGYKV
jgi:hypothetical protein